MLDHPEPYLFAPSALGVTALEDRLAGLLDGPELTAALADGAPAVRLRANFLYDAWLVRWPADTSTDLHAHAGYGAYGVVAGTLRETAAGADALSERAVEAGGRGAYRPGDAHVLAPVAGDVITVHVSSPPLGAAPCLVPAPVAAALV